MLFIPFLLSTSSFGQVFNSALNGSDSHTRNASLESHSRIKRDERYLPEITNDFPHLIGFSRLEAWMDSGEEPCEDFYKYSCGGFLKRYSNFENIDIMKIMGKSNALLMKLVLEEKRDALSRTATEQEIFQKTKAYYESCLDRETIEKRGIKPILPYARVLWKAAVDPKMTLPALFGILQTQGVDVLFRSRYSKVETMNPDDLRLQFFPAPAYEINHNIIKKVLTIFSRHGFKEPGMDLELLARFIGKMEQDNVKFVGHLK